MAFCKVCACGEKIIFERRLSFPDNCPKCGRKLVDFLTFNEDDPRVEKLMQQNTGENPPSAPAQEPDAAPAGANAAKAFALRLSSGKEIPIPCEGGIVGRTGLGAEELAEYPSVSRQHIRVTVRRSVGVLIEDISSYGTFVNGQRLVKNEPVRVAAGSKITLCNVDAELVEKEAEG